MPLSAAEKLIVEVIKRDARARSKTAIEAFSQKQAENITAGRPPFDGMDPLGALLEGVIDVLVDVLFERLRDNVKVAPGVAVSGGETIERGDLVVV